MKDMIDAFASGGSSAQALADFAEAVVTNLGFALQVEMDNARQILMMPQNDGQQSANVLGIHFIQLEQSLPSERGDKVRVFQEHCHEIEIFAPQQLGASYALDEWDTPQSTTVSGSSLGPLLYRLYARRSFQKKKSDSAYQLPLRVGQLRLVAVGHLHGPLFTRWALYDQDDGSRHMGWLGVTELAITRAAFDELQEEDEVSFSLSYAAVLGEHLGMQIASSVHV